MKAILKIAEKRKYELIIFLALGMNLLLFLTKQDVLQDRFYGALVFDTGFGFYSLTLTGSIISLLSGNPSREFVIAFQLLALITGYILTAVFCDGAIRKSKTENKNALCALFVIIACIHTGFSVYTELFSLFDIYWLIGSVLALFCAENSCTRFLVPLLAVTSLWVHFGFIMTFMPLIYVMCFYFFLKDTKHRKLSSVQLVFMVILTVAATLWFFLSTKTTGLTEKEINEYLQAKTGIHNKEISVYVWRHFSDMIGSKDYDLQPFYDAVDNRYNLFTMLTIYGYAVLKLVPVIQLLFYLVFIAPFVFFFEAIWKKAMKAAEKKPEKLLYLLCMLTPLVNLFAILTSTDTSRMAAQLVIVQLLMLMMFIGDGNEAVTQGFDTMIAGVKKHYPLIICLSALYFALICRW